MGRLFSASLIFSKAFPTPASSNRAGDTKLYPNNSSLTSAEAVEGSLLTKTSLLLSTILAIRDEASL
jgi:hypothetical protein